MNCNSYLRCKKISLLHFGHPRYHGCLSSIIALIFVTHNFAPVTKYMSYINLKVEEGFFDITVLKMAVPG